MKQFVISLLAIMCAGFIVGCSDDDNPTGNNDPNPSGDGTEYNNAEGYYTAMLTAKAVEAEYDFNDHTGKSVNQGDWDLKFKNSLINSNGGASADEGDVFTADLGEVEFENVTADDTIGITWQQDELQHIINEWYSYNFQTHEITMTEYVYTLTDAEGDNYIELRVDSITNAGMPPAMGTVWFSYYYNPTANNLTLTGDSVTASVEVTAGNGYWGYFDFSSGTQVFPADPSTNSDWDIGFNNYDIFLNCGPNGPGSVAAFPMHGELTDPTSLEECTGQPGMAPMFQDYIASVFNGDINDADANWYNYNGSTHVLTSKAHIYLILTGTELYKLRIDSYYRDISGVPTSGYYTFIWSEL